MQQASSVAEVGEATFSRLDKHCQSANSRKKQTSSIAAFKFLFALRRRAPCFSHLSRLAFAILSWKDYYSRAVVDVNMLHPSDSDALELLAASFAFVNKRGCDGQINA